MNFEISPLAGILAGLSILFGMWVSEKAERYRCLRIVQEAEEKAQPNTWAWSTLRTVKFLIWKRREI